MSYALAPYRPYVPRPRQERLLGVPADHPDSFAAASLLALAREPRLGFDALRRVEAAGLFVIEPRRNLRQLAGAVVRLRPSLMVLTVAEPNAEV